MKEMTVKEIQSSALHILETFDQYAQEHDLTYYMSGGTLLGAVRHHGFIPWDDDVDLMMPRNDYERLIHGFKDSRYRLEECTIDKEFKNPFARIWDTKTHLEWYLIDDKNIGVFIDIFPMDGYPGNEVISKVHMMRLKIGRAVINTALRVRFHEKEKYRSFKKFIKIFFQKDPNIYSRRLNRLAEKYPYDSSEYVGVAISTPAHVFRERNKKSSVFGSAVYLPFEHLSLPAPSGYDIYLRHLYGEYMNIPPVEKQVSEHAFKVIRVKD